MLIELGNAAPKAAAGPAVTYVHVPDVYSMPDEHDDSLFPDRLAAALDGIPAGSPARRLVIAGWMAKDMQGLPNHEALATIIDPGGLWGHHSTAEAPSWVWSDHPTLAEMIADYHGCPVGAPDDVEDTHWTRSGMPGAHPGPWGGATMLKTNSGNDIQALQMGGGLVGETGTATATSATSLTTNSATSHALNDLAGQVVVAWSSGAYGLIVSNTSGTNTVLTLDRWYTPATPGGSAAATPSSTTGYTILSGSPSAWFMGLTANSTNPAATDVTLAGEITTSGGGLIRKICTYAHTASAASFTLSATFTANGSDSLPVTVAKIGMSQSITSGVRNQFQTLLNATATFSLVGDQMVATDTISL